MEEKDEIDTSSHSNLFFSETSHIDEFKTEDRPSDNKNVIKVDSDNKEDIPKFVEQIKGETSDSALTDVAVSADEVQKQTEESETNLNKLDKIMEDTSTEENLSTLQLKGKDFIHKTDYIEIRDQDFGAPILDKDTNLFSDKEILEAKISNKCLSPNDSSEVEHYFSCSEDNERDIKFDSSHSDDPCPQLLFPKKDPVRTERNVNEELEDIPDCLIEHKQKPLPEIRIVLKRLPEASIITVPLELKNLDSKINVNKNLKKELSKNCGSYAKRGRRSTKAKSLAVRIMTRRRNSELESPQSKAKLIVQEGLMKNIEKNDSELLSVISSNNDDDEIILPTRQEELHDNTHNLPEGKTEKLDKIKKVEVKEPQVEKVISQEEMNKVEIIKKSLEISVNDKQIDKHKQLIDGSSLNDIIILSEQENPQLSVYNSNLSNAEQQEKIIKGAVVEQSNKKLVIDDKLSEQEFNLVSDSEDIGLILSSPTLEGIKNVGKAILQEGVITEEMEPSNKISVIEEEMNKHENIVSNYENIIGPLSRHELLETAFDLNIGKSELPEERAKVALSEKLNKISSIEEEIREQENNQCNSGDVIMQLSKQEEHYNLAVKETILQEDLVKEECLNTMSAIDDTIYKREYITVSDSEDIVVSLSKPNEIQNIEKSELHTEVGMVEVLEQSNKIHLTEEESSIPVHVNILSRSVDIIEPLSRHGLQGPTYNLTVEKSELPELKTKEDLTEQLNKISSIEEEIREQDNNLCGSFHIGLTLPLSKQEEHGVNFAVETVLQEDLVKQECLNKMSVIDEEISKQECITVSDSEDIIIPLPKTKEVQNIGTAELQKEMAMAGILGQSNKISVSKEEICIHENIHSSSVDIIRPLSTQGPQEPTYNLIVEQSELPEHKAKMDLTEQLNKISSNEEEIRELENDLCDSGDVILPLSKQDEHIEHADTFAVKEAVLQVDMLKEECLNTMSFIDEEISKQECITVSDSEDIIIPVPKLKEVQNIGNAELQTEITMPEVLGQSNKISVSEEEIFIHEDILSSSVDIVEPFSTQGLQEPTYNLIVKQSEVPEQKATEDLTERLNKISSIEEEIREQENNLCDSGDVILTLSKPEELIKHVDTLAVEEAVQQVDIVKEECLNTISVIDEEISQQEICLHENILSSSVDLIGPSSRQGPQEPTYNLTVEQSELPEHKTKEDLTELLNKISSNKETIREQENISCDSGDLFIPLSRQKEHVDTIAVENVVLPEDMIKEQCFNTMSVNDKKISEQECTTVKDSKDIVIPSLKPVELQNIVKAVLQEEMTMAEVTEDSNKISVMEEEICKHENFLHSSVNIIEPLSRQEIPDSALLNSSGYKIAAISKHEPVDNLSIGVSGLQDDMVEKAVTIIKQSNELPALIIGEEINKCKEVTVSDAKAIITLPKKEYSAIKNTRQLEETEELAVNELSGNRSISNCNKSKSNDHCTNQNILNVNTAFDSTDSSSNNQVIVSDSKINIAIASSKSVKLQETVASRIPPVAIINTDAEVIEDSKATGNFQLNSEKNSFVGEISESNEELENGTVVISLATLEKDNVLASSNVSPMIAGKPNTTENLQKNISNKTRIKKTTRSTGTENLDIDYISDIDSADEFDASLDISTFLVNCKKDIADSSKISKHLNVGAGISDSLSYLQEYENRKVDTIDLSKTSLEELLVANPNESEIDLRRKVGSTKGVCSTKEKIDCTTGSDKVYVAQSSAQPQDDISGKKDPKIQTKAKNYKQNLNLDEKYSKTDKESTKDTIKKNSKKKIDVAYDSNKMEANKEITLISTDVLAKSKNKFFIEKTGTDQQYGSYKRIVIIGEGFIDQLSERWPLESTIKPYFICADNLSMYKFIHRKETMEHPFFHNCDGKILVVVFAGMSDIFRIDHMKSEHCHLSHPAHKIMGRPFGPTYPNNEDPYVFTDIMLKYKIKFESELENVYMVYSYFPIVDIVSVGVKMLIESKSKLKKCTCSYSLSRIENKRLYRENASVIETLNQLIFTNKMTQLPNEIFFNFTPLLIEYDSKKWSIISDDGAVSNAIELENSLNLVLYGVKSKFKKLHDANTTKIPAMVHNVTSAQDQVSVYVIGDTWLKGVFQIWEQEAFIKPKFYFDARMNLAKLKKLILSVSNNESKNTLIITNVCFDDLVEYKSYSGCSEFKNHPGYSDHEILLYPVPKVKVNQKPISFTTDLRNSIMEIENAVYKRRKNLKIVYMTCYPMMFENCYYKCLSEAHELETHHAIDDRLVENNDCTYYTGGTDVCLKRISKFLVNKNLDIQSHTCDIYSLISKLVNKDKFIIMPVFIPDKSPSPHLAEKLYMLLKEYVDSMNELFKKKKFSFENPTYDETCEEIKYQQEIKDEQELYPHKVINLKIKFKMDDDSRKVSTSISELPKNKVDAPSSLSISSALLKVAGEAKEDFKRSQKSGSNAQEAGVDSKLNKDCGHIVQSITSKPEEKEKTAMISSHLNETNDHRITHGGELNSNSHEIRMRPRGMRGVYSRLGDNGNQTLPLFKEESDYRSLAPSDHDLNRKIEIRSYFRDHRSRSRSRGRRTRSRSRGRRTRSRSRRRRSNSKDKNYYRSKGYRTRSRSKGHRSRSRSKGHRSRSRGKGHRSRSRSKGHRSRSKSKGHRSRSKSKGRRSRSRAKGHRSRSKSKGRTSRSRAKGHRSRSKSKGHRSRSKSVDHKSKGHRSSSRNKVMRSESESMKLRQKHSRSRSKSKSHRSRSKSVDHKSKGHRSSSRNKVMRSESESMKLRQKHSRSRSKSCSHSSKKDGRSKKLSANSEKSSSTTYSKTRSSRSTEEEALKDLWQIHERECNMYRANPSAHPDYSRLKRMWTDVMISQGSNPYSYSLETEWEAYWLRKVETIFNENWEEKKSQCLSLLIPPPTVVISSSDTSMSDSSSSDYSSNKRKTKHKKKNSKDKNSKASKKKRKREASYINSEETIIKKSKVKESPGSSSISSLAHEIKDAKRLSLEELEAKIHEFMMKSQKDTVEKINTKKEDSPPPPVEQSLPMKLLDVTTVLSQLSDKFGALGLSVKVLHERISHAISVKEDPLVYIDDDAKVLLGLIKDKLKRCMEGQNLTLVQRAIIQEALDRLTPFLSQMESDNPYFGLDLKVIAQVTEGKSIFDIVTFIENALAYKKILNVSQEELMKIYLAIKDLQIKSLNVSHTSSNLPSTSKSSQFSYGNISGKQQNITNVNKEIGTSFKPTVNPGQLVPNRLTTTYQNQNYGVTHKTERASHIRQLFLSLPMNEKIKKFSNFDSLPFEEKSFMLTHLDELEKSDKKLATSLRWMITQKRAGFQEK